MLSNCDARSPSLPDIIIAVVVMDGGDVVIVTAAQRSHFALAAGRGGRTVALAPDPPVPPPLPYRDVTSLPDDDPAASPLSLIGQNEGPLCGGGGGGLGEKRTPDPPLKCEGGGASSALAAAANDNNASTPLALLFLPLPLTAARSLVHPALNILALILILLSSSLTWQIRSPTLRLASSTVCALLIGTTLASALALARQLALALSMRRRLWTRQRSVLRLTPSLSSLSLSLLAAAEVAAMAEAGGDPGVAFVVAFVVVARTAIPSRPLATPAFTRPGSGALLPSFSMEVAPQR